MRALRLTVAFGFVVLSCSSGICQSDTIAPVVYRSFLSQVVRTSHIYGLISLNGQPSNIKQVSPQDVLGLTDQEFLILNTIAADCEAKTLAFNRAIAPSVFEARLQRIAAGSNTPSVDMDSQRDQIVLDYVEKLKASLGDARFEVLKLYISSRQQSGWFFPAISAKR